MQHESGHLKEKAQGFRKPVATQRGSIHAARKVPVYAADGFGPEAVRDIHTSITRAGAYARKPTQPTVAIGHPHARFPA